MKITEQDFAEYFPKDNRFLHFCAKYYGMSFHNDEVVEEASFQALKNVMRMWKRDQEFDNEAEKTGMVMSCFRFGILNAYEQIRRRNKLDIRPESDYTYGDGDDEYNKYLSSAVSRDREHDNLYELMIEFANTRLSRLERAVVLEHIIEQKTYTQIANEYETTVSALRLARERALNKLRVYVKKITSTEHTKDKQDNKRGYISSSRSKLRIQILLESLREEEAQRNRYSEALSFVYLDE
jgi:RNA polymerase sigma factor (sigma-70 family)